MVQSSHEHNVCEGKGRPKEREGAKVTRKEERKGGREDFTKIFLVYTYSSFQ